MLGGFLGTYSKGSAEQYVEGDSFCDEGLSLTRLFFTNDSLLFQIATTDGIQALKLVLSKYELLSGQKVSLVKSSVFFSKGIANSEQQAMAQELGIALSIGKGKYLGCLTLLGDQSGISLLMFVIGWLKKLGDGRKNCYLKRGRKFLLNLFCSLF